MHALCLSIVPASQHLALTQAMICGENLHDREWKTLFLGLGVYHIIVVSGSHFVLLDAALQRLKLHVKLRNVLLAIYVLVTGYQAACVRGFAGRFKDWLEPSLTRSFQHFIILSACLVIEPLWIRSLSLQLSCLCALVVACRIKSVSLLRLSAEIFLFCFPLLQQKNFLSILWNGLFSELLAILIGLIGLIEMAIPVLAVHLDGVYGIFQRLLVEIVIRTDNPLSLPNNGGWNWVWIGFLFFSFHCWEVRHRRRQCCR